MTKLQQTRLANSTAAPVQTFHDHVVELRNRLSFVALAFIACAALSYPFFALIMDVLVHPLGDNTLYYLTPLGGIGFIIKVCMFIGALGAIPFLIFHLYKYLLPVIKGVRTRIALWYGFLSLCLAIAGIVFAYVVSLPAALHFLTNFDLEQVTAMLTVDSYFSFVVTYLLVTALLFQIPLIMAIIDTITPLKPRRLMGYQRHVVLAAFIVAAVVSPTPDMVNQTLLAAPMIAAYQVGIGSVYLQSRRRKEHLPRTYAVKYPVNKPARYVQVSDVLFRPVVVPEVTPRQSQPKYQPKPRPKIMTIPTRSPIKRQVVSQRAQVFAPRQRMIQDIF